MRLALTACPDDLIRHLVSVLPASEVELEIVPSGAFPGKSPWDVILACARRNPAEAAAGNHIRAIRRRYRTIPILAVTGPDDAESVVAALDAGADAVIQQPLDEGELRVRLRRLAHRRWSTASPTAYQDLQLHPTRHSVTGPRGSEHLTPREYQILQVLLLHPEVAIPREEIRRTVWGSDDPGSPNLLEVHVCRLRKKLRSVGADAVIRTVRGVGYALGSPNGDDSMAPAGCDGHDHEEG